MLYFSDYKQHNDCKINPSLLWEYETDHIDYKAMRNIIVQRVLERGWMSDYYAMFNLYGYRVVRQAVKEIPYMNDKDMSFACQLFNLKKEDLKCYKNKLSKPQLWNS
ncbi:MAG: hypothetical protein IKQ46_03385 [Bacteroidales bacterium]|nr:hypothetical protein [Bacteroidales bacterium]